MGCIACQIHIKCNSNEDASKKIEEGNRQYFKTRYCDARILKLRSTLNEQIDVLVDEV